MPRFDAVLLDLDGTLVDTESIAVAAGVEALAQMGHDVGPEVIRALVGRDHASGHRMLAEMLGAEIPEAPLDAAWTDAARRRMADGLPLRPGVHALLDRLDALEMARAVVTSSKTAGARHKLDRAGLAARLPLVIAFEDVTAPKPAPEPYLAAAARLSVDPARCLAFEDSETGAQAARAAGCLTVQVPDLEPASGRHADHVAETLLDGAALAGLMPGTLPFSG